VPTGWGAVRRWPPEIFGAPALLQSSIRFYLPGAEEVGLVGEFNGVQFRSAHIHSLGLTEYMEGVGCASCGNEGSAVHNGYWDFLNPYPMSIEIFNNFAKTSDEGTSGSNYSPQLMAAWDHVLQVKSPRIWGVSINDWNSALQPLGTSTTPCWPQITMRNRDRGKLQVLLPAYNLSAYLDAFEAGAFFAVVEDNEIKSAYPTVTQIDVTYNSIAITTAAWNETVRWIGNGEVVAEGFALDLTNLPADLVYARAEIADGEGRTVYTQPFSLGAPIPPPPGAPVPTLSEEAAAFLVIALLVVVMCKVSRSTARA